MIHVVIGPPCGGKSTYVREHAKPDDLRVDFDEIAQALGASSSHDCTGLIKDAVFEARKSLIESALKNPDAESYIIHTFPGDYAKRYKEAGAEFVTLDPGKDECLRRAHEDNRPKRSFDGIERWYSERKSRGDYMLTKDFAVKFKDEGNGSIEGYASTFVKEPDSYGDIVAPGAFTRTLNEIKDAGKTIPFLFGHRMDSLDCVLGKAEAWEDDYGLAFKAEFDSTENAQKVRQMFKDGRMSKFSFAYGVREQADVTLDDGRKANELRDLDLYEISAVFVPANPTAEVTDVKACRRNSKSDEETIKQIISLATSLLETKDDDKPTAEEEAKANEASEEQKRINAERKAKILNYINKLEET